MMEWILSASVLAAAVIALRYALGGRISPRIQYALWALVLVRLLVPVNFGSAPFSVGNAIPTLAAGEAPPAAVTEPVTVASPQPAAPAVSPETHETHPVPASPADMTQTSAQPFP